MFNSAYFDEWAPYEEVAASLVDMAAEYLDSGYHFREMASLESALSLLEELESSVSSYVPAFTQVRELKDAYLRRIRCLREILIRFQSLSFLISFSSGSIDFYKAQQISDEIEYYIDQLEYWSDIFSKRWDALNSITYTGLSSQYRGLFLFI